MTLLKMIKKYEGIKTDLERVYRKDAITQIETVEAILKDLRSVEAHPSRTVIRDKLMKKMEAELDIKLDTSDFEGIRNLAQALHLMYLPE